MKLKIEFINEDTSQKIIVKNKGNKVFYHDSDIHDEREYEELTGKVLKLDFSIRKIIESFYNLSSSLSD